MIQGLRHNRETVLIKGRSGTGKEHLARAIHQLSSQTNDFFIKVNSAHFTRELLDTRLLGKQTVKNSAILLKEKKYEKRGTVYFESIEKMPLSLQRNLLYFLESGVSKFFDVNGTNHADYRIVASAGEEIEQLVERKKFRKDLYFRLNSIDIKIPALKDRKEDIPWLANYFADQACMQSGKSYFDLSEKTKQIFSMYHWPFNVEELEKAVKKAVFNGGEADLVSYVNRNNNHNHRFREFYKYLEGLEEFSDAGNFIEHSKDMSLKEIGKNYIAYTEKIYMKKALEQTNWNRKKAAKKLSISYKSLLNKINEYSLS